MQATIETMPGGLGGTMTRFAIALSNDVRLQQSPDDEDEDDEDDDGPGGGDEGNIEPDEDEGWSDDEEEDDDDDPIQALARSGVKAQGRRSA